MYKPTSFRPHIPKSYIPTSVIFSIYNPFFAPHFRNSKFLHLLLSYLTLPVHIVYFLTHASICTHALMVFFTIGLTHISTTTLTHVSQYRPFITNGLYYTHKMSHHHIKKTTFAQLLQFWITIFSPLFLHLSWQVYTPRCKEGQEFCDFTQYIPHTSLPPNPIHSLSTFQYNAMFSSHNSLSCLKILKSFPCQNIWRVFKFPVVDLS